MSELISPTQLSAQLTDTLVNLKQSFKSLTNEDEVVLSIEQDQNLALLAEDKSKDGAGLDINSANRRDEEITSQIELCNRLWVIKGFLEQLGTDLHMNEFESFFYNMTKLQVKLKEFQKTCPNSMIIDNIGIKLNEYEAQLESNISNLINGQFWKFDEHSVCFTPTVEVNEYSELTYEELNQVLNENYEKSKSLLSKRIAGYLNLNSKFDSFIVQPLINCEVELKLEKTDTSTRLIKVPTSSSVKIRDYIISVHNCITFVDSIPNKKSLQNYVLRPVLNSLEKKLLEENIDLLIRDADLKESALRLAQALDENNWFNNRENLLQNWVNDSINYWIDKKFKSSLEDIRDLKQRLSRETGVFRDLSKEEKKDSWDWNEEGEDEEEEDVKNIRTPKTADDDDDGWDAWAEDDDELFDEKGDLKDDDDNEALQVSKIPSLCYDSIILPFLQLSKQIKELNIEGLLMLRLKDLLTDLFIVLSELYQAQGLPCLFYNDFQKILSMVQMAEISDSLQSQLNGFLELAMNEYKFKFIKIWESTIGDFEELQSEDDSEDEIFLIEFNDYVKNLNRLISSNYPINSKILNLFIISNHSFILDFLTKKIFAMTIISEQSSLKISAFQKSFIKIFKKTQKLQVSTLKNFNKFERIADILNDNLKTIEAHFNDGDYFDFATEELTSLIELLFVESEMRSALVAYIRDVRTTEE